MSKRSWPTVLLFTAGILLAGGVLAWLDPSGRFFRGWFGYSLLLALGLALLASCLHLVRDDGGARKATIAAWGVRLLLGILLTVLLPLYGYKDQDVHENGYWFFDAYNRDNAAWKLATSEEPLISAFVDDHVEDQYGGMLALSAGVYRYLSPDYHRTILILIVTATIGALGVPFLWKASRDWFDGQVALAAAWIFALYPEAVILGSSQMREGFIMSGMALGFFGLANLREGQPARSLWLALAGLILFFFSPPAALMTFGLLFGLWFLDSEHRFSWRRLALFAGVTLLGAVLVISIFSQYPSLQGLKPWEVLVEWFQNNQAYQIYRAERASGRIQLLFREAGEQFASLIILAYGVAQPVLPANLVVPGNWIVRILGILRAAGWYALAPLLIYGLLAVLRPMEEKRRRQLLWVNLWVIAAVLIAALVAGGDAWDNPRYRTWLIAWQALLAGWAFWWARRHQDAWLGRLVLVEGIFVLIFLQWYISRYTGLFAKLFFWQMVALILAIAGLILIGGWIWDRLKKASKPQPPP